MAKPIKEIKPLRGKEADRFLRKMIKREKSKITLKDKKRAEEIMDFNEKLKDEFNLSQIEVHDFGQLVLERIFRQYEGLLVDTDHCWGLENDLKLLNKLITLVVRLQNGRILREYGKRQI